MYICMYYPMLRMSREIVITSQLSLQWYTSSRFLYYYGYKKESQAPVKLSPFTHSGVCACVCVFFSGHILCTFRLKEFKRDYYHVKIHRYFSFVQSLNQLDFFCSSFRFVLYRIIHRLPHIFFPYFLYFFFASVGFYTVLHNLIYYSKEINF